MPYKVDLLFLQLPYPPQPENSKRTAQDSTFQKRHGFQLISVRQYEPRRSGLPVRNTPEMSLFLLRCLLLFSPYGVLGVVCVFVVCLLHTYPVLCDCQFHVCLSLPIMCLACLVLVSFAFLSCPPAFLFLNE